MKKGFWTADWFAGLLISLAFLFTAYVAAADYFLGLESTFYDAGVRASATQPSDRVAVVAIDDASIQQLGRWPWPRSLQAELLNRLRAGGAKVIGSTIFYSEPQDNTGAGFIRDMRAFYDASSLGVVAPLPVATPATDPATAEPATAPAATATEPATPTDNATDVNPEPADTVPSVPPQVAGDLRELRIRMDLAISTLDMDTQLAAAMREAGNVVLPMFFELGIPQGRPDGELPPYMLNSALLNINAGYEAVEPIQSVRAIPPIPVLGEAATGLGHLSIVPDRDGAYRYETLVLKYYDLYFPSFALTLAAKSLNLRPEDITVTLGEGVTLGNLRIDTTPRLEMYNFFYNARNDQPPFLVAPFVDVLVGRIPADAFRDKIVLIGATATGIGDAFPTPVSANMAPVLALAHTVSAILQEDFFTSPAWAPIAQLAAVLLIALYLILLLPRMRAGRAAFLSLVLLLILLGSEFFLMTSERLWVQFTTPAVFLVVGHLLMTIKRFRVTEKLKLKTESEGAESNKMLGLAFQGQGQLDMAFDKFRKCPLDDSMLDVMYNLALDYERKRQHNKAGNVYAYMAEYNPNYRDLQQRLKRAKTLEQTVVLGGGGGGAASTLVLDGDDIQKPMLGRYQVEKELGKGAMGVVYLGRDPKINRVVAIKTMALAQEFEPDELEEVKARFFREAETAGRLNHPHIVTIYDAGEEHDLAYIAMEFLKGQDLTKHVKPGALLTPKDVFNIIADAADALDYAHQQNVVHRDIKPANLMYESENNNVKITDFGIARITDSSKTKTGMVLGTPSYMSPEQLAGKKVDGRSDLFSLGVTFYQMLSGQLPFQADSMATLMFKIANEAHAPVSLIRPELPACADAIINKTLDKNMDTRYARGADLAHDIRACAHNLG